MTTILEIGITRYTRQSLLLDHNQRLRYRSRFMIGCSPPTPSQHFQLNNFIPKRPNVPQSTQPVITNCVKGYLTCVLSYKFISLKLQTRYFATYAHHSSKTSFNPVTTLQVTVKLYHPEASHSYHQINLET